MNKTKIGNIIKCGLASLMIAGLTIFSTPSPVLAEGTNGEQIQDIVKNLWDNKIYGAIKDIGGTLAIATFVGSAFYFFIIGKDRDSLNKAKGLMIGSGVGIFIIYVGPKVIQMVIDAVKSIS